MSANKTILVVEQDAAEAEKILNFFRENGFKNKIEMMKNKREALNYIFNNETPGLILLDLLTNKTPDIRVLKPLQSYLRTENIPIVILTSSAEQEKEVREYGFGVMSFIRKPLDFTRFIEVIQSMGIHLKEKDTH